MRPSEFKLNIEHYPVGHGVLKYVDFPSFYGVQKLSSPIYIHRASESLSPCIVVTACIHGDEINGLRIAQSLIKNKLKLLKGTLIVIPAVNIYGLINQTRYLPDNKDLNRCFPGSPTGSFGSRFSHFIFENIKDLGDVFIDLHSGSTGRFNVPQIRCDLSQKHILQFLKKTSIPLVLDSSLRDGSLREAVNNLGKIGLVFEGGEGLRIDETITKYGLNLIHSILAQYEMIKIKKKLNYEKIFIHKSKWIRAREGGLLINFTPQGKVIKKNEIIGEVRKINGDLIHRIQFDYDGIVLGLSKTSMIMEGDALYHIGFTDKNITIDDEEFFDYYDFEI